MIGQILVLYENSTDNKHLTKIYYYSKKCIVLNWISALTLILWNIYQCVYVIFFIQKLSIMHNFMHL